MKIITALLVTIVCSQANAQIGIGQCLWKSDGTRWVLVDCSCSDSSVCSYPTGHAVPPAGVTQQFPADGGTSCTPRVTTPGQSASLGIIAAIALLFAIPAYLILRPFVLRGKGC